MAFDVEPAKKESPEPGVSDTDSNDS
jgi:hypothetical protein